MTDQPFKINEIIINKLKSQHMQKKRLGITVGIHHKTIYDKLNFDRFDSAYDLLKIAKVLRIDLNELRDKIEL